jgi:carbon-monoxide dehydrogenase medium subunit
MSNLEIHQPENIGEVFARLKDCAPDARPMGGGTALMLMMKAQLYKPSALVSLAKADPRFHGIAFSPADGRFSIGAMTTFAQLEADAQIAAHLPVITQTMVTLANPRVRNVATIGGNLAHADPHLDMPPVWYSLDASLDLIGPEGQRSIPVSELFVGYYETTLKQDELIMRVNVKAEPGWRRRYVKITTRSAHDWPAVGMAIGIKGNHKKCEDVRLVVSAVTDCPTRLPKAEAVLRGQSINAQTLAECANVGVEEFTIHSDNRGSADYKAHLFKVHLQRNLQALVEG